MRFRSLLTLLQLSAVTASASVAPASLNHDFVAACIQAFDQSSGNGSLGIGRQICECAVKESKHQGVTRSSLRKETAKIKADSKYRISDRKLLSALQYCSIEIMRD